MSDFWREVFTFVADHLIELAMATVSGLILQHYLRKYRRRVELRDHVVEVSEDFAIPRQCVSCASLKAPFTFAFHGTVLGQGFDGRFNRTDRREFVFHFCLDCSRRLRRRRRRGVYAFVAPFVIFVSVIALARFVPLSSTRFLGFDAGDVLLILLVVSVLSMPGVFALNVRLHRTSPDVSIVYTGEETIFFDFANQAYRDAFARLNGEDF